MSRRSCWRRFSLLSAAICVALWSLVAEGRSGFEWTGSLVRTEAVLAIAGGVLALPLYYWLLQAMEGFQLTASQWMVTVVGVGEGLIAGARDSGMEDCWLGAAILLVSFAALLARRAGPGRRRYFSANRGFRLDEEAGSVG